MLAPSTAVVEPEVSDGSATRFDLLETSSSESALTETLSASQALLENVPVTGDLSGEVDFTGYQRVTVETGLFAGKGFAKGELLATFGDTSLDGHWRAVSFFDPVERKINLKGVVYGNIGAITEGFLTESVPGSGTFDQYHDLWRLTHVGTDPITATVELSGTLTGLTSTQFPSTALLVRQASMSGTATGAYTGPLGATFTRVRIEDPANPYNGEGFSLISYNSALGSGDGWAYEKVLATGMVDMRGLFLGPLTGAVVAFLDAGASPPKLMGATARIDAAAPLHPDLKVNILAPGRASPGQRITYVMEYRNDGWADAPQVLIPNWLDESVGFVSASPGASYNPVLHMVDWDVGQVAAKTSGFLTLQVQPVWGLPAHTMLEDMVDIVDISPQAGPPPSGVLYVNGIGNCGASVVKNDEFSGGQLRAYWAKAYNTHCFLGGLLADIQDVLDAKKNKPTAGNALNDPLLNNRSYDTCWAYSGGTVTIVTAIRNRGLRCKRLVLVSTWLWNKDELTDLHTNYGVEELILYQSAADAPIGGIGQFKLDRTNPADKEFLDNNTWVDLRDRPGVKHGGDMGWIYCLNKTFKATGIMDCNPRYLTTSKTQTDLVVAGDPNAKSVSPTDFTSPGGTLNYTIDFENEGEGIAFGVYITDTLDEDLDGSTLVLPPAEGGTYDPATRTISWFIGEVGSKEKGQRHLTANVRGDVSCGAEVINFATVYFPSVPETTPTNGVVVTVAGPLCDTDGDGIFTSADDCPLLSNPADADGDGQDGEDPLDGVDNDSDGRVDEDYEIGQEDSDDDGQGDVCDDDGDGDSMPDAFEALYSCLDPLLNDAALDPDDDALTNLQEFQTGTPFDLGADPCNPDTDADTVSDGGDADPLDPYVCQDQDTDTCDDCSVLGHPNASQDGTDTDADGACNAGDNCIYDYNPGQTNTDGDEWGDACDYCPTTATPWHAPAGDDDCDGFTTADEGYLTTDSADACPDGETDDAWPPDLTMDTWVDVGDILMYKPYILTAVPPSPTRYDLAPDQFIDVGDILMFRPFILTQCTNP